jgi:thymidylate synthase
MSTLKNAPKMGNDDKKVLFLNPAGTGKKEAIVETQKEVKKEETPGVLLDGPKVEKKTTEEIIKTFAPSAEERIKNADNFKILTNKFAHLKTKSDELKRFKISSDGTKEKIYLENAEGFKFEVSNSKIVDATLKLLETTLDEILSNTEKQVQEFII